MATHVEYRYTCDACPAEDEIEATRTDLRIAVGNKARLVDLCQEHMQLANGLIARGRNPRNKRGR